MANNTVFDSVFKTLIHKAPHLIVPFINEAFGRSYPQDTPVVQFSNEHETPLGSRVDDSVFRLQDKLYHVECQSTPDSNMVVRMIEYDFAIALEQAIAQAGFSHEPVEIDFPSSCVLFLRHTQATPDALRMKVNLPEGESFLYTAKVVKAQLYNSEEIFDKHLLLLLPYYLMRYENLLDAIAKDDVRTAKLIEECVEINSRLATTALESGDRLLYEQLVELIIKVSDHIMAKHEGLRKKVRKAMGGEVLELLNERALRLEREAREKGLELGREQGLEQGREQGLKQGREQGLKQGMDDLAAQLKARGIDESVIMDAIAAARESRKSAQ